ncbi:flaA [Symbiodinium necroappetens]|uniref:FlaA protein n=1 Tax=Symbiodinium necroappetens TaxID=1628268 RepID=A0A812MYP1_9DINO|nr:flaA [Symbiodinium necroappetens]
MTRINTNVSSIIAQRVLNQNTNALGTSLERLSTGLRINRGADDPAGLIASEALRAEITSTGAAIGNAERADQVLNIAEGGLQEISSLLEELQGLVTSTANTAGLSLEEKEANQLQIDSILQTIDRLADSTSFQGAKLLNGRLEYTTSGVSANVNNFDVRGAKLGFQQQIDVEVIVTQSAQRGALYISAGASPITFPTGNGPLVIEVAGAKGSREFSFASGTTLGDIRDAINTFSSVTGTRAATSGATGLRLESTDYGDDEYVSVTIVSDGGFDDGGNLRGIYNYTANQNDTANAATQQDFASVNAANGIRDAGQDVGAAINGVVASSDGTTARINTDFLNVEVDLTYDPAAGSANAAILGNLTAFTITGGGADFQLAGDVNISGKESLGIPEFSTSRVGRKTIDVNGTSQTNTLADLSGANALNVVDGNLQGAQEIVDQAIREVATLRGRLGAFQVNTVGSTIRSLGISLENTTAAESVIRDADFAGETAALTRGQVLTQSATQVLTIANSTPQNALTLLG